VCDLKMSYIGEPPQLVSVYKKEEWPPRVFYHYPKALRVIDKVVTIQNAYPEVPDISN